MGDYCDTIAAEALMTSKHSNGAEQANPQLRKLHGVRLAVANESKAGHTLDTGVVKLHSGGGYVTARALHENPVQFTLTHKLMLMTNHRPNIADMDEAMRGRLHLIPFDMRWNRPGHTERNPALPDGDKGLAAQLKAEAPGVLAWLVAGAVAYLRDGLEPPAEVTGSTRAYMAAQDPLAQFLATLEACDARQGISASELFAGFQAWAEEECRDDGPATQRAFSMALKTRGIAMRKGEKANRYALRLADADAVA
jgi:putative DNA primase/helicase